MKRNLFVVAEGWLRMEHILYGFWAMFWTLNGLDKFFNGGVQEDGTPVGWFGVTRDQKMIDYFARLSLPEDLALVTLYGMAVLEIIIGVTFVVLLLSQRTSHVVHRLAFKGSMVVFFFFSTGDILFGDRAELWEHGTFMILALVSFRLYLDRSAIRREVVEDAQDARLATLRLTKERLMETIEFDDFLRELAKQRASAKPKTAGPKGW